MTASVKLIRPNEKERKVDEIGQLCALKGRKRLLDLQNGNSGNSK